MYLNVLTVTSISVFFSMYVDVKSTWWWPKWP